jgi:ketosteroid isomerase-like protein
MNIVATPLSKEDVAAVEELFHTTLRLAHAGEFGKAAEMWADDGVLHPPNGPAVRGRPAIQQWHDGFPQFEAVDISHIRVSGEGNLAYVTCAYTIKVPDQPTDTGKELLVLRRGSNGWELVAGSFNSDLPAPTPAR